MCVMQHDVAPHITSMAAAEILGRKPREVLALIEDGTLDAFTDKGILRVSLLSVTRLWVEQGLDQLRAEGIRP